MDIGDLDVAETGDGEGKGEELSWMLMMCVDILMF